MSGNNIADVKPFSEVEQVETVLTAKQESSGSDNSIASHKDSNIFSRFWHSIYQKPTKTHNAWKLLTNLNNTQRVTFVAAFFGWTLDAFDFFSVSLSASRIAKEFDVEVSAVTSAITSTLMLRSIGALIFGALADKYGRRWPLMIDIVLFSVINMASGFAPNLQTFIGLRAVFGIAMGGEWGLGASLALESLPVEARGLFSGIYQEGYACGYLLATLVNYAIVQTDSSWRILFWVGASFSLLAIFIRFFVPESGTFEKQKEARRIIGRSLLTETKLAFKHHWRRIIYMIILMAFMNFFSHGSQDLYPTFLTAQLGYTATESTVTSVIMNIGAIIGGIIFGYLSNYFGRRFILAVCAICAGAFIPLWALSSNIHALQFGAFVMQFFVQGGWGVIPAHINELAPSSFRGLIPGLAYQLGNLISAASSQIEATISEKYPLRNADGSLILNASGKPIPNYGLTQAIFMGVVCGCLLITAVVGKEQRNIVFEDNLAENEQDDAPAITAQDINEYKTEGGEGESSSSFNEKMEKDQKAPSSST